MQEELKNIQLTIKHRSDTLTEHEEQLKNIDAKIKLLDKDVDQQATYVCKEIKDNCPFIKVINKKTFDQLEKQKELLEKEKDIVEAKIKAIKTTDTSEELKTKEKSIEDIKLILNEIDRKQIEKIYDEVQELQTKEKSIDTQIVNME